CARYRSNYYGSGYAFAYW
nr:immunoglobulin heavy chain junction region [Mus musculus]MBK4185643.1 immunoglobulin heavy chain junction region [Mus musculus]